MVVQVVVVDVVAVMGFVVKDTSLTLDAVAVQAVVVDVVAVGFVVKDARLTLDAVAVHVVLLYNTLKLWMRSLSLRTNKQTNNLHRSVKSN